MDKREFTHLYRHFNSDGELLYVGVSLSAINRLGQHKEHSKWFSTITKVEIQSYATREEALDAEAIAINSERPKYNKRMSSTRLFRLEKISKESREKIQFINHVKTSKSKIIQSLVLFDAVYSLEDAAMRLDISSSALRDLIHKKKIGTIELPPFRPGLMKNGFPYPTKLAISGWQLIDYLESLHGKPL